MTDFIEHFTHQPTKLYKIEVNDCEKDSKEDQKNKEDYTLQIKQGVDNTKYKLLISEVPAEEYEGYEQDRIDA